MATGILRGSRLAYVVVEIEGTVQRPKAVWTKKDGIKHKMVEEPAGYMVYFPRGHCIRIKDKKRLKHYKLHKEPTIIQLEGLNDPNSPLGKMFMSQDQTLRAASYKQLEQMVIDLCNARGSVEFTRVAEAPNYAEAD